MFGLNLRRLVSLRRRRNAMPNGAEWRRTTVSNRAECERGHYESRFQRISRQQEQGKTRSETFTSKFFSSSFERQPSKRPSPGPLSTRQILSITPCLHRKASVTGISLANMQKVVVSRRRTSSKKQCPSLAAAADLRKRK